MTQDRLQGATPSGSGYPAQPEPASGLGPSGGHPSRGGDPRTDEQVIADLERYLCVKGTRAVFRRALEIAKAAAAEARASDERPTGPRPSGLGGDSPASAVVVANSEDEAHDLEVSGLAVIEATSLDKLKRENAELREALRPFVDLFSGTDVSDHLGAIGSVWVDGKKFSLMPADLIRARTLLSQSSEGE